MKSILGHTQFVILIACLCLFSYRGAKAQCPLTITTLTLAPTSGTTFVGSSNFSPGTYFSFPVLNGGSYAISTCGSALNTQLTGYPPASAVSVFYNDDNGPICNGTSASVDNYVPNFTNYLSVQVSQFNCLGGGASSAVVQVRQNNNLVFTSSSAPMCSGTNRNLSATPSSVGTVPGGYGNPGSFSGTGVSGVVFSAPSVTAPTNYTITYTFGYVTKDQVITVNPNPTITASASSTVVCFGSTLSLNGSGANTYSWTGGVTNGIAFTASASTTYSVFGTNSVGCTSPSPSTIAVNVIPLPFVTAGATSSVICSSNSVALFGGGANTYTWSGGVNNGVSFIPIASANYTVIGTLAATGCTNTATQSIVVNPSPSVTANSTKTLVCSGENITLTAGGALTYTWSNGVLNGIAFSPNITTIYSVTGTAANGCTATNTVNVQVYPCLGFAALSAMDINNVQIYPNPSSGEFMIKTEAQLELNIINDLGQVVRKVTLNDSNHFEQSVNNLATGIYFVISQDKVYKHRIVVEP